jgi:putative ABC transport system ATP-binding protein
MSEMINLQNVVKQFNSPAGPVSILKGVSLQIEEGEFVGIVGPSGSGKSTLLNMLTGIDRPTSGEVHVLGTHLNRLSENGLARWRGRNVGIIFQFFQLLPTLTAIENVILPMHFSNVGHKRERRPKALTCLELVGMAEHAHKLPGELSGGQQQRVAIARALVNDPPFLVADEPTGNLDSGTSAEMFALFQDIVAQGKTMVMVTHDAGLANLLPRVIQVLDGQVSEHTNGQPSQLWADEAKANGAARQEEPPFVLSATGEMNHERNENESVA